MRNLILASLLGALSIVGCDTAESPTAPSSNVREARAEAPAPSVGGSGSGLTTQGVGIRQISQIATLTATLTSNFWTERRDNSSDRPCKTDYGRFNIFASWSSAGADEYEYKVKVWNTATGTIGPNIRWGDVEKTGEETIDGDWTAHRKKTGSPKGGGPDGGVCMAYDAQYSAQVVARAYTGDGGEDGVEHCVEDCGEYTPIRYPIVSTTTQEEPPPCGTGYEEVNGECVLERVPEDPQAPTACDDGPMFSVAIIDAHHRIKLDELNNDSNGDHFGRYGTIRVANWFSRYRETCVLRYWNPDAEDVGDIAWGQTKETCSPGYVRGDKGPYPEGRKHYYCVVGPRS